VPPRLGPQGRPPHRRARRRRDLDRRADPADGRARGALRARHGRAGRGRGSARGGALGGAALRPGRQLRGARGRDRVPRRAGGLRSLRDLRGRLRRPRPDRRGRARERPRSAVQGALGRDRLRPRHGAGGPQGGRAVPRHGHRPERRRRRARRGVLAARARLRAGRRRLGLPLRPRAADRHPVHPAGGRRPLGRQPAEGAARQVAGDGAGGADRRRADPRRRRGRALGDLPHPARARAARPRAARRLLRPAGGADARRPDRGHGRRAHRRRAAARGRHGGGGATARDPPHEARRARRGWPPALPSPALGEGRGKSAWIYSLPRACAVEGWVGALDPSASGRSP
jgi:hypothetical protein